MKLRIPIGQLLKDYKKYLGKSVELCGWVHQIRRINEREAFVPIRDATGIIQTFGAFPGNCTLESVIQINGTLQERPQPQINTAITGGNLEVLIEDVSILNGCSKTPPFTSKDNMDKLVKSDLKSRFRYLEMRLGKSIIGNLKHRQNVTSIIRKLLQEEDFLEVETPLLFKCTPEGAAEFNVSSSKNPHLKYSLPQSPQQFKQTLMMGGIERYFQFAKCFRDEELSSDRQPEFTQLDIEMAFVDEAQVMNLTEKIMQKVFSYFDVMPFSFPLPVISYSQAMKKYGTDSPDTRFGLEIEDNSLFISGDLYGLSESDLDILIDFVKSDSEFVENEVKIERNRRNLTIALVNEDKIRLLGRLRVYFERYLSQTKNIEIKTKDNSLIWINNFPLFEKCQTDKTYSNQADKNNLNQTDDISQNQTNNENDKVPKLVSTHHPFTAVKNPDEENPLKMIAKHYDLVMNGSEIGGGSIRIHNSTFQEKVFREYLKLTNEDISKFSHLLTGLSMGCPPHGGIALGFDRLMAILLKCKSIREVIAFPKNNQGYDALFNFPEQIHSQMSPLHLEKQPSAQH